MPIWASWGWLCTRVLRFAGGCFVQIVGAKPVHDDASELVPDPRLVSVQGLS